MAAVFAFGKRGANNSAPVSNYSGENVGLKGARCARIVSGD